MQYAGIWYLLLSMWLYAQNWKWTNGKETFAECAHVHRPIVCRSSRKHWISIYVCHLLFIHVYSHLSNIYFQYIFICHVSSSSFRLGKFPGYIVFRFCKSTLTLTLFLCKTDGLSPGPESGSLVSPGLTFMENQNIICRLILRTWELQKYVSTRRLYLT
jgi:hypothetical protein